MTARRPLTPVPTKSQDRPFERDDRPVLRADRPLERAVVRQFGDTVLVFRPVRDKPLNGLTFATTLDTLATNGGSSMSRTAVGDIERAKRDRSCPHDKFQMAHVVAGEAVLDVCNKCGGQFFDSGEMFAAFGIKADPSFWDRAETGGVVKEGERHCPECEVFMLAQDVSYGGEHVEIDRCGKCGGIFLDKDEIDKIIKISDKLAPTLEAERQAAASDLAKLGTPDFAPGLIAKFVKLFKH
jgi:Zn-finger nucleic acid-binding protein